MERTANHIKHGFCINYYSFIIIIIIHVYTLYIYCRPLPRENAPNHSIRIVRSVERTHSMGGVAPLARHLLFCIFMNVGCFECCQFCIYGILRPCHSNSTDFLLLLCVPLCRLTLDQKPYDPTNIVRRNNLRMERNYRIEKEFKRINGSDVDKLIQVDISQIYGGVDGKLNNATDDILVHVYNVGRIITLVCVLHKLK